MKSKKTFAVTIGGNRIIAYVDSTGRDLNPGDMYIGKRNTDWQLARCGCVCQDESGAGWVEGDPAGSIYPYGLDECRKVKKIEFGKEVYIVQKTKYQGDYTEPHYYASAEDATEIIAVFEDSDDAAAFVKQLEAREKQETEDNDDDDTNHWYNIFAYSVITHEKSKQEVVL